MTIQKGGTYINLVWCPLDLFVFMYINLLLSYTYIHMEKLMQVNNEPLLRKIALEVHDLYIQNNVDRFKLKQEAELSHTLSTISVKMYINMAKDIWVDISQILKNNGIDGSEFDISDQKAIEYAIENLEIHPLWVAYSNGDCLNIGQYTFVVKVLSTRMKNAKQPSIFIKEPTRRRTERDYTKYIKLCIEKWVIKKLHKPSLQEELDEILSPSYLWVACYKDLLLIAKYIKKKGWTSNPWVIKNIKKKLKSHYFGKYADTPWRIWLCYDIEDEIDRHRLDPEIKQIMQALTKYMAKIIDPEWTPVVETQQRPEVSKWILYKFVKKILDR